MKDPADYIIGLMKSETDALGFIPAPHIKNYLVPRQQYLIQTDARHNPRGYLLHGPPKPGQPLRIYQLCIDHHHRRIYYATKLLHQLTKRARTHGATEILLRCALDLEANHFWLAMGALPVSISDGGRRRNRKIVTYKIPLLVPQGTYTPITRNQSQHDQ